MDDVKPILARRIARTTRKAYWRREWLVIRRGKPSRMSLHGDGRWIMTAVAATWIPDPGRARKAKN